MSIYSDTLLMTPKYADYILNTRNYKYNFLEGSYRSSKSVFNCLGFALYLENTEDMIHLVIASTVGTARSIVEDGDGKLGLAQYFGENYKRGKYKNLDAGLIKTKNGIKTVVYLGGAMKSSYSLFRGWSVGGILLEELDLLHENTINEVKGRILLAKDPKVFMSMNPNSPTHPIYTWLDDLQARGLVNYLHTTLVDNPALTEQRKKEIMAEYDPASIFYQRFILGKRVVADNLVYNVNEDNIIQEFDPNDYISYIISCDQGESISSSVFTLVALREGYKGVDVLKEYKHRNADRPNSPDFKFARDYASDLAQFVYDCIETMEGMYPKRVSIDRSESFYRECATAFREAELDPGLLKYCIKDEIAERIKNGSSLLYRRKLRFYKDCKETINGFKTAQYDPEASKKGKLERLKEYNEAGHGDAVDSCEYGFSFYKRDLFRKDIGMIQDDIPIED